VPLFPVEHYGREIPSLLQQALVYGSALNGRLKQELAYLPGGGRDALQWWRRWHKHANIGLWEPDNNLTAFCHREN
jgi:hypothetical protein